MKYCFFLLSLFAFHLGGAQVSIALKGKIGFGGNGIIYFSEENGQLYADLMGEDTYRFIDLYERGVDSTRKFRVPVEIMDSSAGTYHLRAVVTLVGRFTRQKDTLGFFYDASQPSRISLYGKPVLETKPGVTVNAKCNPDTVRCNLALYNMEVFRKLNGLKNVRDITEKDMKSFLAQMEKALTAKCNLCNEEMMVSDMNAIIMSLGYNPISAYPSGGVTRYHTSAFYDMEPLFYSRFKHLKPIFDNNIYQFYTGKKMP